jgi:hypothetical protein
MQKNFWLCWVIVLLSSNLPAQAPTPWTWEQVRQRFEQNNPTLQAGKLSVDEAKANVGAPAPRSKARVLAPAGWS